MKNISGKTALITGASSGLGRDFAHILAEKGCNLILVARREQRLNDLRDEITGKFSLTVTVIAQDLGHVDASKKLYDIIAARKIEVDILINNAGFGLYGQFIEIPWEQQRTMLELDMLALTELTNLYAKDMLSRGSGQILFVSSIAAYQPTPTYATYAAAKSYVLHFGEALNYELRNTGVSVSVLSPGVTKTEFLQIAGQKATLYQRLVMMESRPVAEIGIRAMLKGKPSVLPGLINKLTAFSVRLVPRRILAATANLLMAQRQ